MKNNEKIFEKLNFAEAPHIAVKPPGPKAKDRLARQRKAESQAIWYPNHYELAPERGLGATVMDADGNYFIDFSAGVGVLNCGHSHPDVVEAIKKQSEKITFALDFPGESKVKLSEKLVDIAPGKMKGSCKIFHCPPTGSDAIEAAVKLSKFTTGKPGIISFEGGYHGASGSGLWITGQKAQKMKYLPGMAETYIVPYAYCYRCPFEMTYPSCDLQCAKYLEHVVRDPDTVATSPGSVIMEAIQGEGGIVVPPKGYLEEVRRICDEYGLIFIVDEIQTGFGRTGKMFCSENFDITPDTIAISKSMGGGMPLSALIIKEDFDTWTSGAHMGTFRGNLLSCAAGLAAVNFIDNQDLPVRSERLGKIVLERMNSLAESLRAIGDVRGKGLYVGVEFVKDRKTKEPAPEVLDEAVKRCFERGLILWKAGRWNNVARIMPALVISEELLNRGLDILEEVLISIDKSIKS